MQFLGIASVVALLGIVGVSAADTLRGRGTPNVTETSAGNVALSERRAAKPVRELRSTPASTPQVVQAATPLPVTDSVVAKPVTAPKPASHGGFVLVDGRTTLTDSIFAIRGGDSVIVNFDTQGNRTRRFDKFERSLRLTLPMVYGKMSTAPLDTLKEGALVTSRDIVGELATTGMRLTLENGVAIHIRALVRVGRDGPLAVGYLTKIER